MPVQEWFAWLRHAASSSLGSALPRDPPHVAASAEESARTSGADDQADPEEKNALTFPNGVPIPKGRYEDMSDKAFRALVDHIINTNPRVRHIMQSMTKAR